jgi:hypothetical protein
MLQDIGGGNLRVGGRLVLTVHAHVASFGRHFFPTETRPEYSNLQSQRAQRLEAFCAEKPDILDQRPGRWVYPSRRVILWAVVEALNVSLSVTSD